MRPGRIRLGLAIAPLVALAAGCSEGIPPNPVFPEPGVFPQEARLGATAAIALDSNYIPFNDILERYDLHRDRVQIYLLDDTGAPQLASLQGVFSLGAHPAAITSNPAGWGGAADPGKWVTVAVFDLPVGGTYTNGFHGEPGVTRQQAARAIRVDIDGAPALTGSIVLTGTGGAPTTFLFDMLEGLEPRPMIRLRARRGQEEFHDEWVIGALELEIWYPFCLQEPRAHPATNAVHATAIVAPGSGEAPPMWQYASRVVMVDPNGFTLAPSGNMGSWDPTLAGQGPLLDISFDTAPPEFGCASLEPEYFEIRRAFVADVDGTTLIDRREAPDPDSSDLFALYIVDAR